MNTVTTTMNDPWYDKASWVGFWAFPPLCIVGGLLFGGVKSYLSNKEFKLQNRLFREWTPDSKMTFQEKYQDGMRRTPLLIAIQVNNLALVEHLLKQQQPGTVTSDYDNNTPLHYAAAFGTPQMMRRIIDSAQGPLPRNSYDLTPLDVAVKRPNGAEIVAMIKNEAKFKTGEVSIQIAAEHTPLIPAK